MTGRATRQQDHKHFSYTPRLLKFVKLFAAFGQDQKVFPKRCKNCGRTYRTFSEYMKATTPLDQSLENYESIQNTPYTIQYRNCSCGSTLALAFTEENFPMIREFWAALYEEARETGNSLRDVINRFRDECNQYMDIDDAS